MIPAIDVRGAAAPPAWHTLAVGEVLNRLQTTAAGLASAEAARRLAAHGANALDVAAPISVAALLWRQLRSVVVLLLAVVAAVATLMGDHVEAGAVVAVLVLNTGIGFWTEWRARLAMDALRRMQVQSATVVRDGARSRVDARALVPGDRIELAPGDAVPADARLLAVEGARTIEAPLTGEPFPVDKRVEPVRGADGEVELAERACMVYKGTLLAAGSASAVVVATGRDSEIGRIAELIGEVRHGPAPIERRLEVLGRRLIALTLGIVALVAGIGVLRGGEPWMMIQTALALAVAAVPEGLPVVATIALAVGMRRMAQQRALVRRLPAVEALGSVTVVCSDKTGTLTAGEMTVGVVTVGELQVEVTGIGYRPLGEFHVAGRPVTPRSMPDLARVLTVAALANRASIPAGEVADGPGFDGDPSEAALLVAAAKAGIRRAALLAALPELGHVPFSSETMWMATLHELPDGDRLLCVKGAPDRVLGACARALGPGEEADLDERTRARLRALNDELGGAGLRVLAIAERRLDPGEVPGPAALRGLTFLGYAAMRDAPAPGAAATVARLRAAGVRTIMITGDQAVTAAAIGSELGVLGAGELVLEGAAARAAIEAGDVSRVGVFARLAPEDKVGIVGTLQARGEIVGMLGDGVNDAPALKQADVGVAMGGRGTDVAKETADVVLLDDRFQTIGVAVEQGRVTFDNIRKFVFYLFSCNVAEVATVFVAGAAGLPIPLLPLQILWLNLITDVFPALALAVEPAEPDVMARPPRDPDAALLSRAALLGIAGYGVLLTAVALGMFAWGLSAAGPARASTLAFMTLGLAQGFHALNARTIGPLDRGTFARNGWVWAAIGLTSVLMAATVAHAGLARVLGTVALGPVEWMVLLPVSMAPVVLGQLWKRVRRRARSGAAPAPA
jgi:Ca2+-transporting ATPase